MSIYKELNDKEWLIDEYLLKMRSCLNISKEIGCNNNAVRQALIKHGIGVRNQSQAQIVHSTTDLTINNSVLDGILMGDAYLQKWRKGKKSLPSLLKKNKYLDHLTLVSTIFELNPKIKQVEQYLKATGKVYTYYQYRSCVDPKLEPYYLRWYPETNDHKKVIPDDIEVDETFLLHWFLDDGFSHRRDRSKEMESKGWKQNKEQITVGFCSQCFELEQQKNLCDKINDKFDLGVIPRRIVWKNSKENMDGYMIYVAQKNANKFFEIIGECPIESLKYKWKITNN